VWIALSAPQPAPAQRTEQLSALFKAKVRAGTSSTPEPEAAKVPPPIVIQPTESEKVEMPTPVVSALPRSSSASTTSTAPASTSAALLAKKRAREKKE